MRRLVIWPSIALLIHCAAPALGADGFSLRASTPTASAAAKPRVKRGPPVFKETVPPALPLERKKLLEIAALRTFVSPIGHGMFVRIPVIDRDPNRGTTLGFMPIWVLKGEKNDRIERIHAPSITWNHIFKIDGTYRYFYYPSETANLLFRVDVAQIVNREVFLQYEDLGRRGEDVAYGAFFQYNVDGSQRFFGIGPDTPRKNQSNWTLDTLQYQSYVGLPIRGSLWYVNVSHRLNSDNPDNGPIATLPNIDEKFPEVAPLHRHQNSIFKAFLNYDSRDSAITTTEGSYAELSAGQSQRDLLSEYSYQDYSADLRRFYKAGDRGQYVTAGRLKFEQLIGGNIPFWLMPELGGKYTQRAYGDGRYVDKGMATASLEERITVLEPKMGGVRMRFEAGPFTGLGAVFDAPDKLASRYLRPVFGAAFHAVAPPQIVGSLDVGFGQEGATIFIDVNYSF